MCDEERLEAIQTVHDLIDDCLALNCIAVVDAVNALAGLIVLCCKKDLRMDKQQFKEVCKQMIKSFDDVE